jgi:alpha-glucosidase
VEPSAIKGVPPVDGLSAWWRSAVLYQIYPRSFVDFNGDGVGDLAGVTAQLDYLVKLGVDAVWLSPIYSSPMVDFGYDITDHCRIDPIFGTLEDFDQMLAGAHGRGLRVVLDFVPNHTSDRHPWFEQSRASRTNPRRDWYVWADPDDDGGPPNNWLSSFAAAGSAWTLDAITGQYYLHSYAVEQPDLNWANPAVREAMIGVLRFWLDRGVDGFRVDAVHRLIKDPTLAHNPPEVAQARTGLGEHARLLRHIDQPGVHDVIRELRAALSDYEPEPLLLGEVGVADPERWAAYYGDGDELMLTLNFAFWSQPWSAAAFHDVIAATTRLVPDGAWPVWALGNHDIMRLATRYDQDGRGPSRARLAAMMLLTLRGTPLLYYGDEIGMTNVAVPAGDAVDIDGRDAVRTPMQWSPGLNAGFTTASTPWLPVPDARFENDNVTDQQADPGSLWSLYHDLIALRRSTPALSDGESLLLPTDGHVLAYRRAAARQCVLVALNFDHNPHSVSLPADLTGGQILLSTDPRRQQRACGDMVELAANEGVIIKCS